MKLVGEIAITVNRKPSEDAGIGTYVAELCVAMCFKEKV